MRRPSHLRIAALVSSSVFLIGGLATPAFAQSPTITGFSPPSGAAGASVTIIGTAFTAVSDVQFNGTSAAFSVDSHTQITSSVPTGATTGPISVVTPHGTGISKDPFTVIAGSTRLVSTSDSGVKGNADSTNPAMPADGSKVAFRSLATNLAAGDTDTNFDEYVKDLATGHVSLISTSDSGVKGNGDNANPVFSADGSKVAFRSSSTNLDPGDTDTVFDIYVKTLASGDITLASTSDTGVKGNRGSYNPFLSADGSIIAFRSYATNLDPGDTDKTLDVYVKNLVTGDITLASTSSTGVKGNGASGNPALSADGTKVAFYSNATNLDPGDTDSLPDIYVKDLTTGKLTLASTSDAGIKGNGGSDLPYLSADGSKVAFTSAATNLDPGDTNSNTDIYVKNLVTGDITLVSTSSAGSDGNGPSVNPYLSADGTKVTFASRSTNLDPADTDQFEDVYLKDLTTGTLTLLSTSSAGVKGNADSLNPAMSADASLVAFYSGATNLDPADTDTILDVYVKAT